MVEKTELEKAETLGKGLVGAATDTMVLFRKALGQQYGTAFKDESAATQSITEVAILFLHIIDRMAHIHLNPKSRFILCDHLVGVVIEDFLKEWTIPESFRSEFTSTFWNIYNPRQLQYSQYRELFPAKEQPFKGTLYWEFSKIICELTTAEQPAPAETMTIFIVVADSALMFLTQFARVEKVLKG